jgi:hypothetical protein
MAWVTGNAAGDTAAVAWADETRAAIVTDEGITTSNSTTGQVITLNAAVSTVDEYAVELHWQEDPGPNAGYLYVVKTVSQFTVCNSGTTTGKKIHYRARLVVSL